MAGRAPGWRHDTSGTCQQWARVVLGAVEETAWIDLAVLRLPEAQVEPVSEPRRIAFRVEQELPTAQAVSVLRGGPLAADAATTAAPTVTVSRPGSRRRAPEDADIQVVAAGEVAVPVGRHRAPRDEGRHRAADTEVVTAVAHEPDLPTRPMRLGVLSPGSRRPKVGGSRFGAWGPWLPVRAGSRPTGRGSSRCGRPHVRSSGGPRTPSGGSVGHVV